MEFTAVIPAGGIGSRSGLSLPKQFFRINGKELIAYTLEVFQNNEMIKKNYHLCSGRIFPTAGRMQDKIQLQ